MDHKFVDAVVCTLLTEFAIVCVSLADKSVPSLPPDMMYRATMPVDGAKIALEILDLSSNLVRTIP